MPKPALQPRRRETLVRDALAKHIMSTALITVHAETRVVEGARILIEKGVSNAPVVQRDFTREILVGFVSEKDVMQCYASGRLYREPDTTVEVIMRPHPISVRPETDLYTLAAIFMQHSYRHLPVTVGGVLQGMVSRRDVLAALIDDLQSWKSRDPATRQPPDVAGIFTPRFLLG